MLYNTRRLIDLALHAERQRLIRTISHWFVQAANAIGMEVPPLRIVEEGNASSDGTNVNINLDWVQGILNWVCPVGEDHRCSDSVLVGVSAHELAHHLYRHVHERFVARFITVPFLHEQELQADYLSGWVMAKLGIDTHAIEHVLVVISESATVTHPAAGPRINAIRLGYEAGLRTAAPTAEWSWG